METIGKKDENANGYPVLINLISSDIYHNIAESTMYESAMQALYALSIKKTLFVRDTHC